MTAWGCTTRWWRGASPTVWIHLGAKPLTSRRRHVSSAVPKSFWNIPCVSACVSQSSTKAPPPLTNIFLFTYLNEIPVWDGLFTDQILFTVLLLTIRFWLVHRGIDIDPWVFCVPLVAPVFHMSFLFVFTFMWFSLKCVSLRREVYLIAYIIFTLNKISKQ